MSPRSAEPRLAPYAQAVPAVRRAVRVLEHLVRHPAGLTLAELGRAASITPSSLLAILRTLQEADYVVHDPASRLYRVGPRLAALGRQAGRAHLQALAHTLRQTADALAEIAASAGGQPAAASDAPPASGPLGPRELADFLAGPWLATLACLKDDGYPYTVPVWYEWDGTAFWVVARARSEWAGYLRRDGRVSLSVSEREPPLRRVVVEGRAEVVEAPGGPRAREIERRMARRYLGTGDGHGLASAPELPRWLFRIQPEKMLSWRGLTPHARYQSLEPSAAATRPNASPRERPA